MAELLDAGDLEHLVLCGQTQLSAKRERGAHCSDLERLLFNQARSVPTAVTSKLSIPERGWLVSKLEGGLDDLGIVRPHVRFTARLRWLLLGHRSRCRVERLGVGDL